MKAVAIKKSVIEMATELHVNGRDASGPELADLVSQIMRSNGYDPEDLEVRKSIGNAFKQIRSVA